MTSSYLFDKPPKEGHGGGSTLVVGNYVRSSFTSKSAAPLTLSEEKITPLVQIAL